MTTAVPEPETPAATPETAGPPDAASLQDRMPDWFRTPRAVAGLTLAVGLAFVFLSYRPLWHTDLWGHLAYGRILWETRAIPETEPLMPLAEGVPFVNTAWLSQLVGFGAYSAFGVPGIQFLYAASITLCLALLAWRFQRRTGNAWIALAGCAAFAWVNWQQLIVVRPQLAGLVCFVALLVLLTSRRWHRANWVVIPVLFALWANLHGSFLIGLALLGCFCVGRACDVLRRTDKFSAILFDPSVRRYFLLTQFAAVAVLLNPYGLGLYAEVFAISGHPNLQNVIEWEPLTLRIKLGLGAAAAALALVLVYRLSPRRVSVTEVLLLAGLGAGALWTSRLLVWWAPVAAYCLVLHGGAVWRRYRRKSRRGERDAEETGQVRRSSVWTVVSIGLVWICFGYTPFGFTLLHGPQEEFQASLSEATPVRAVEYLRDNPPPGLVFNTFEWGDYLVWAGPPGIEVFVTSHAHLVPEDVWRDYMRTVRVHAGWDEVLDRYGVSAVVVDKALRRPLVQGLRRSDAWYVAYEDGLSAVFFRTEPLR
jgi:hypothetical protein